jgi:hypothetical protein
MAKGTKGIEPSFCAVPREQIRSGRGKDGGIQSGTKAYMCEDVCDFFESPRSGQPNGLSRVRFPCATAGLDSDRETCRGSSYNVAL